MLSPVDDGSVTSSGSCFGSYREAYVRGDDGRWRCSYRRLERTHVETSRRTG